MTALQTSRATAPAPSAHPRLTVAWIALAYALGYLGWSRFGGASEPVRAFASESVLLPLNAAATFLFLRAARRPRGSAAMRPALRLLAAAGATLVLGNAIALVQLHVDGRIPTGSLADVCFLVGYPLTLAALLRIPGAQRREDRWKLLCDAGMVLSGAGVALWYFVLRAPVTGASDGMAVTLAMVYPLADLLLLVGLVSIALRQAADGDRIAVRWLALATSLMVVADLWFNLLVARTGQRTALSSDLLFLAGAVATIVAAERFWQGPIAEAAQSPAVASLAARLRALLPFAAAGATYALLLVVALRAWVPPLSGLAVGAVAVSIFLGARQLFAFRRRSAVLAEAAVRASEARFRSLVQNSSDLTFQLDEHGAITFASSSSARVIGYQPEELVGRHLSSLVQPEDASQVTSYLETAGQLPAVSPAAEWRFRRPDGRVVQVEAVASNLLADATVCGIVLNVRDVGERKALLDQLAYQAFHDPLTGLANRALFYDRVAHALTLAHRHARTVMVLFLDLDDFKQVNDTLGHAEGDRLLTMIAARLRACARATDTVARLGGDEFALLVEDQNADEGGTHLVERIREQMTFPFHLGGADLHVSTSIGSATARDGSVDDILRHADVAMYSAKRAEKGSHRAYDPSMLREERLSGG
jgi:diguanylate cyclase (GGDEF)-like protein/PAS domain S-box-containing protein